MKPLLTTINGIIYVHQLRIYEFCRVFGWLALIPPNYKWMDPLIIPPRKNWDII